MKKENNITIITIIIMATFSLALLIRLDSPTGMIVADTYDFDYALNNLDSIKNDYNNNLQNIPGFLKSLFGNEIIDLKITRTDGTVEQLSMVTKKGVIQNLTKDRLERYTLELNVSEDTINEIMESEDQITSIKDALDSEAIKYRSLAFGTRMKIGISRFFLNIRSWFRS